MLTLMKKMRKIHGPTAINGLQMGMANLVCKKMGQDANRSIIDQLNSNYSRMHNISLEH